MHQLSTTTNYSNYLVHLFLIKLHMRKIHLREFMSAIPATMFMFEYLSEYNNETHSKIANWKGMVVNIFHGFTKYGQQQQSICD